MTPRRRHSKSAVVFLVDVDRTLLDDARVTADLRHYLLKQIGSRGRQRYWTILQRLHRRLGYADYLGALQHYRKAYPNDPHVLALSSFLINYPFDTSLLPHARDVIRRWRRFGSVVILSDGDVVFQPHKIERSGLAKAVGDHVLVYVHKDRHLRNIRQCYPASHYVVLDDNVKILTRIKNHWGAKVTTILIQPRRQREKGVGTRVPPDLTISGLSDLLKIELHALLRRSTPRADRTSPTLS